jgi:hypothetical protein
MTATVALQPFAVSLSDGYSGPSNGGRIPVEGRNGRSHTLRTQPPADV